MNLSISVGDELMKESDNDSEFEDSGGEDHGINALKGTCTLTSIQFNLLVLNAISQYYR